MFCPRCGNRGLEKIEVPTEGKVYSYTKIHVAPPEYADLAPYHVVLVQLTDNLRVTAYVQENVQIGETIRFKEVRDKAFIFTTN